MYVERGRGGGETPSKLIEMEMLINLHRVENIVIERS